MGGPVRSGVCLCHCWECAPIVTICVLLAQQIPPWSPEQQLEVYRKYHCVAQRLAVRSSHVGEAEGESEALGKELLSAQLKLEKARKAISKLKLKSQTSRGGYHDVAICLTGKLAEHASKLEARGELYDRVPKRLFGQIESAVERHITRCVLRMAVSQRARYWRNWAPLPRLMGMIRWKLGNKLLVCVFLCCS